jgi:hypothetical protein
MPGKPAPPPDDPEQSKRFINMAREVDAEGTEEDFVKAFRKVAGRALSMPKKRVRVKGGACEPQETKRHP